MARRWGDLSERSRNVIIATAIGEAILWYGGWGSNPRFCCRSSHWAEGPRFC